MPEFNAVLDILMPAMPCMESGNDDFDARNFKGAPYSWDGDWTNSSLPAVARICARWLGIVSRANNIRSTGDSRACARPADGSMSGPRARRRGREPGLARAPHFSKPQGGSRWFPSHRLFAPPPRHCRRRAAPGRPGLSALHVARTIVLPRRRCRRSPARIARRSAGTARIRRRRSNSSTSNTARDAFGYDFAMDPEDLAEILKNIRSARENADFVIVSIHSHECTSGCDDDNQPAEPGIS